MNVVIFGRGFGKPRQVEFSGGGALGLLTIALAVICSAAFAGGYWYSAQSGTGMSQREVARLAAELEEQKREIAAARQEAGDTLDALAMRIGQMNARVIRLDALGRRLTEMADLGDGEFDFDSEPALGGPEEPYPGGSAMPEVLAAMEGLSYRLDSHEAQLGALESVLLNQQLVARVRPQGRPLESGWISSYFGRRTDPFTGKPANHRGIDFAGKAGSEVLAVADGVVTWSSQRYGYGQLVEINHGNGYATRYAHNSENLVAVGDEVRKGQPVALMGDTGRATGPNLHFEVLQDGRQVNPVNFIRQSAD